ncbi:MAG: hypothetical protein Ta2B_30980 [Termitinemataceae bacterium]|nr:MAG: hypothetical protein Ta2B_30980 [Termitinemataceae bacterium]
MNDHIENISNTKLRKLESIGEFYERLNKNYKQLRICWISSVASIIMFILGFIFYLFVWGIFSNGYLIFLMLGIITIIADIVTLVFSLIRVFITDKINNIKGNGIARCRWSYFCVIVNITIISVIIFL